MDITLLQWNIWNQEQIEHIAEFILALNPDIVCVQELTLNYHDQTHKDTPAYLAAQLGYNYHYQDMPIEGTDGVSFAIADGIFSRFPITAQRSAWINETKSSGGYNDEFRAYVEATLDVNGTELTVATSHMSYTHRFEPTPNKNNEADALVAELQKHPKRFIFAGDLNAPPESYTIEQISKHLRHAGPDLSEKTWTTKPFSYNGFAETELNWRLDYVFVTPDINVVSSEVLPTDYSDHLPILTKITL